MTSFGRPRPDSADLAVAATAASSFVVLLWLGRGLTFFADEWAVIVDRPLGIDTFFRPFVRRRAVPGRALACYGAIVAMYAIFGLVRSQVDAQAVFYSRYSYLSGIFALLGVAVLVGRFPIPTAVRRRELMVGAVMLAFALSLIWNVQLLVAGRDLFAQRAERNRALVELGLSDPLPAGVDPALSLVLVPSPVRLHAIVARYGSPLQDRYADDAIPPITDVARADALARATDPPAWLLAQPWLP
jgi:hypothetical protein